MKRLSLSIAGLLLALPITVWAQGSTNIRATDTSTGAGTQVGDNTNHAVRTNCVAGCAGGTSDTEDGTVAGGQTTGIQINLNQVWDGSNWKRLTIGVAGTPATQVGTVQGIAGGVGLRIWDGNDYLLIDGSGNLGVTGTVAVSGIGAGSQLIGKVGIDQTTPGSTNLVSSAQSGTWSITCTNCSGTGVAVNEDVASANADPGTPSYAVRQDTPAGATSADGDYQPLKSDSLGRLWINCATGCAGGTQFAEDVASANADVGTLAMARRTATPANTSGADLDYETLQMNAGRLWVDASGVTLTVGSHAVTNVGTFVTQENGAALTSLQLIDDPVRNEDAVASDGHAGFSVLTVRQDTPAGSTSGDGDYQTFKTDSIGRLWVNCGTGCSGGTQYAEDNASASGDLTVFISGVRRDTTPTSSSGTAGDYSAFNLDANGRLYTQAVLYDATGTALTVSQDSTIDAAVGTTGPLMLGRGSTATPTGVSTDGDAQALWLDLNGRAHTTFEKLEDAAHASGDLGAFVLTKRTDAAATSASTDGDYATLNTDGSGRLWVNCGTGCSGGTQFAEDAASVNADVGTIAISMRSDAPASTTSTDGDYTTLKSDSIGRLWVNCGTGCSGGTQYVEDAASAGGETMTLAGAVRQDTLASVTSADGDYAYLKTDSVGRLYINDGTLGVEDAAETASGNLMMIGTVRRDSAASSAGTTGDNATLNTDSAGRLWVNCGTGCAGTEYTEDAASGGAELLTLAGAVRQDTLAASTSADGDFATLKIDAEGALYVRDKVGFTYFPLMSTSLDLIDNAIGTEDNPETNATGLSMAGSVRRDTAASSAGTTGDNATINTDSIGRLWVTGTALEDVASADGMQGQTIFAIRDDTLDVRSGTEGDFEPFHTNANGALWTIDVNSAALLTSNQLQDDIVMAEDAVHASGQAGVMMLAVRNDGLTALAANGDYIPMTVDGSGQLFVTDQIADASLASLLLAVKTEDAAETAGSGLMMIGAVRRDTAASSAGTAGDNATVNVDALGLVWGRHLDPCSGNAKTTDPFSLTARGVIVAAAASKKNYICSISVVAGAAEIFNVVEGTGTTCQTGTAAIVGSTTAANGMSFAANGGAALIGGDAAVLSGKTANVDTCILPSGSNRLAGFVTYVQQ